MAGGAGKSKLMDLGEEAQFGLGLDGEEEVDEEEEALEKESERARSRSALGGKDGEGTKVSLSHVLDNVVVSSLLSSCSFFPTTLRTFADLSDYRSWRNA